MSLQTKQSNKLEKLFNPRSVGVVGASNTPGKVGYAVIRNLIEADFSGEIIPINLNEKEVQGIKAYPSVSNYRGIIECLVICVPAKIVPSVLEEAGKKQIKNAVIITAGFSEIGNEGKKLEEEIHESAKKYEMNIVGPNTLGVINTTNGMNASFATTFPTQGSIAIVSQSGALCTAILDWARQEKIGFSKLISTGNKTFLSEGDYFDYLLNDDTTKAVMVYMESVKNSKAFLESAKKLAKKKPLIIFKSGKSAEGQKAASSHTGAMSVDDEIFSVACKKANAIRVESIEEFYDFAELITKLKKPKNFNVAIVTNAGGPGVIAADSTSSNKLILAKFDEKTIQELKKITPNPSNPLDLIGDAKPINYKAAIKALETDSQTGIIFCILTPQSMTSPERVADILIPLSKKKPLIATFMGGSSVANPRRHLKENGVTEFETPERGLKVLAKLKNYFEKKEEKEINVLSSSAKANKELKLISGNSGEKVSLKDSFEFIEKVGINTTKTIFVKSAEELEKAIDAQKIKLPVAIKIANGLAHKTDLGLVKTNLETKEEVINAFNEMQKKIKEFDLIKSSNNNANNNSSNASNNNSNNSKNVIAVQEMLDGKEVIVSAIRTEFGFVVTYGLGGIFVEIMKDYSQKIVPLSEKEIDEMLSETKGTKVLMGARTKKKYAIEELKKVIMLVTKIVYINPEIKEIEFNPLIINEKGCYAIDAVIVK